MQLGENVRVQRGTLSYAEADLQKTAPLVTVNTPFAMAWNGVSLAPGAMESEATAATEGDTGFQRLKLANATTLQGDRGESCGGTDCAAVGHFEVVDFQPLGGMRVESGYYQGNASAGRAVYVGFQPDAVLVKRVGPATDRWSVLRTSSMTGDNTKDLDNAGLALAANLVQSLTATGFTVGSDARVNENLRDYYWVAFKAADGEMKVGQYSGTGAATRSIAGVGFQPDYLIVMPDLTADPNGIPLFAGSTYPADTSFDFDATQRGPNCIRALESDGFQVGTGNGVEPGPSLNGAGVNYYYVAWNAVPGRMAVGTYAGDDAATRNLDVAGFFPEWVVVKKFPDGTTGRPPTHKPASTGTTTDLGLRFVDSPTITNTIKGLRPLGFQVGNDERVNSATLCTGPCTYHWVAFGPHVPAAYYRSIGTAADLTNQGTITVTAGSTAVTQGGRRGLEDRRTAAAATG